MDAATAIRRGDTEGPADSFAIRRDAIDVTQQVSPEFGCQGCQELHEQVRGSQTARYLLSKIRVLLEVLSNPTLEIGHSGVLKRTVIESVGAVKTRVHFSNPLNDVKVYIPVCIVCKITRLV
ncbi:hypothetical protein D3C86_1396510 [compost metagenome]